MRRYMVALLACLLSARLAVAEGAKDILGMSGVTGGLIVHVGCGDGKLTAALRVDDGYLVHGLDLDGTLVREAREHIENLGVYGKVSVERWGGERLPYIGNLVNLIVVTTPGPRVSEDEMLRVLVPGGVAVVGGRKIVKPWPAELDEWTHWLHGPDNNAVSSDKRVGISRNLQWIMPPLWGRHHNLLPSVSAMVSAGGRIFYIIDEAPIGVKGLTDKWSLVARDAFNGLVLWKRPIENWGWKQWSAVQFGGVMRFKGPDQIFRRLVAVGDTVYVTLGFKEPVVAIDGATGKTTRVYKGTENASEILYCRGLLLLTRNAGGGNPGKDALAVDAGTGRKIWERKGYTGVTSRGDELKAYTDAYLTAGDDKVFFLDRDDIVALDMKSGKEAWKRPRPKTKKGVFGHNAFNFAHFCTLVYHDGMLFLGQIHPAPTNLNKWQYKDMVLLAMDAGSGKKQWEHTGMTLAHFTPPDLFVNNGLAWTMKKEGVSLCGLDVRTGALKKEYPVRDMLVGHHHRCYRNKATERYYLAGEEGIEYIDFDSGKLDVHHWLRGACSYGLMPANGLIYMPTHACGCHSNAKLNGFFALSSRETRDRGPGRGAMDRSRLEKGPAYGRTPPPSRPGPGSGADWPVYKHDNRRSNHVPADVPVGLSKQWARPVGGRLTPPVIADNKVFFAAPDRYQVYCLNAKTGEVAWKLTTDGPVDTPPSFCGGRLIFGTHAGSVYTVSADDGTPIWRFRAAPENRRLMAHGRLESPWPVNGSVLVVDGKAFCVAGRSMHLDSGLYVCVLDLKTGKILQQANLKADTGPKGELKGAVLPDILVSDGDGIYMRHMRFEADDITKHGTSRGGGFLRANDGGLLDGTWLNNTFWRYMQAQAQMLVFDGKTAYGIKGCKKLINKSYGQDIFTPGKEGYQLYAADTATSTGAGASKTGKGRRRGKGGRSSARPKWQQRISVRAQGMVLTDSHLFLAGAPDTVDRKDPWAAFEDRRGGALEVRSKEDGKKLAEYKLDSAPVYDGLAAANGRLFMTLRNGTVLCMGGKAR